MGIKAAGTAPNFATGEYHRINRAELICSPKEEEPYWNILVGFYFNEEARHLNADPMYTRTYKIPLSYLATLETPQTDPRTGLYDVLMTLPPFVGSNAIPSLAPEETPRPGNDPDVPTPAEPQ